MFWSETRLHDIVALDHEALLQSIFRSLHYLNELEDQQTGIEYFETMIRYLFSAAKDLTKKDVEQILQTFESNYPEGSEVAMTLADMWREEGMEKGMEKGIEKGIEKGRVSALSETAIQMLTERFGNVPRDIEDRIASADADSLQSVLVNSYKFQHIDEARKYLH